MNLFIAGICGTFMGGIAQLAKAAGHQVRGCDTNPYPPMSDLLAAQKIPIAPDYSPKHLQSHPTPDLTLIGNALSRGNPLVEHILNHNLPYQSGAHWLRQNILTNRPVIAIAGTHGKTTTSSILTWLLTRAGKTPGYLIGGKPGNFPTSAHLGNPTAPFIVEADEYDTAFFDKRAKFIHYRPHLAILNNLEYDHADIYPDLAHIQQQFHFFLRTIPSNGHIIVNADDPNLAHLLKMGYWSNLARFSTAQKPTKSAPAPTLNLYSTPDTPDHTQFTLRTPQTKKPLAQVNWQCIGHHNMQNATAALLAAQTLGIPLQTAADHLSDFTPTARRLQLIHQTQTQTKSLHIYDDFAHHPTAIHQTLTALRNKHPNARLIALVELRSNTMKMGIHHQTLPTALKPAHHAFLCTPTPPKTKNSKNAKKTTPTTKTPNLTPLPHTDPAQILPHLHLQLSGNDCIVTMSNGSFNHLAQHLSKNLKP